MDKIAVLDFGCQYTHQIGESVRRARVYSEIIPHDVSYEQLKEFNGIILSGSPDSVYEKKSPKCDKKIFNGEIPVLGICYGLHLMARELGGKIGRRQGEYGEGKIRINKRNSIFKGLSNEETVWMSHGDSVLNVPNGFDVLAVSDSNIIAAIADEKRKLYGMQFHPEVSHTPKGDDIIRNFALYLCNAKPEWDMTSYIDEAINQIKEQVGDGYAVVFVSGGVDSSVAAVNTYRALGSRVRAIYFDNGFGRKEEAAAVKKLPGICVEILDKSDFFIEKVGRTLLPEKKRHIIGDAFIEALYSEIKSYKDNPKMFLVQGTIYPDSIESGEGVGRSAAVIKSHHNVASKALKELKAKGRVVEPNIRLFKYEVREVARLLGLPAEISERHPFPGPGLSVRYVGRVMKLNDHKKNETVCEILDEYGLNGIVVPIGTVGVKGSDRAYGNVVLIYGKKEDYEAIRKASDRLGNEIPDIVRTALVLNGKKYTQEEWNAIRRMHITKKRLETLREADDIVMSNLKYYGLYNNISQMPVVLFPGPEKRPWIALRPVVTPDFMTLRPPKIPEEMSWNYFDETAERIIEKTGVGGVVLDATNKPPATTEWE